MYIISIIHPTVKGQHDISGGDRNHCLKVLKEEYPNGGYTIIKEQEYP
jgi:hypothetical protein